MRKPIDTPGLTQVRGVLEGLSGAAATVEDDLLSCLVVMGEPDAQATVDAWVDQVVDLLRAVDEVTGQHLATLSRVSTRLTDPAQEAFVDQHDNAPAEHR